MSRLAERLGFARHLAALAVKAGNAIMACRAAGIAARAKADGTLVTEADMRAHEIIEQDLTRAYPGIAVVSEESCEVDAARPETFFLVDPLDGTRDFVEGTADFTVNIALVEAGRPVAGALFAPMNGRVFAGDAGEAFQARLAPGDTFGADTTCVPIRTRQAVDTGLVALESLSHPDLATQALTALLAPAESRRIGSSLKFALIAAGEADLYVRGIPLCEWDIAAGDAVLQAAGGCVLDLNGRPLVYGEPGRASRASPFVALGDPNLSAAVTARIARAQA